MARASEPAPAQEPAPPPPGLARSIMEPAGPMIERVGLEGRWYDDIYHRLTRLSWPRFFLLFSGFFLAINLLFAGLFMLDPAGLSSDPQMAAMPPFLRAFFFSVHTIATVGYGNIVPRSTVINVMVVFETACGILIIAITSGLMFARFSRPTAKLMFARVGVIRRFQGMPTLILRVANLRSNVIINTDAQVTLLRWERDGDNWVRRFHDLKLMRTNNPIFFLSWQLLHVIDEASPLAGLSHEEMVAADLELVVLLSGTDTNLAQPIHAFHVYSATDLRHGHRFVDVIDTAETGGRRINYRLLHDTVAADHGAD